MSRQQPRNMSGCWLFKNLSTKYKAINFLTLNLEKEKRIMFNGKNETKEVADGHMCVNPNTCDVCRKIFLSSIEATKKSDGIKRGVKKDKGIYFANAQTW